MLRAKCDQRKKSQTQRNSCRKCLHCGRKAIVFAGSGMEVFGQFATALLRLCYMEVAVNRRSALFSTKYIAPVFALLATLMVGGCADVLTYSKDSQQKGLELYREQQFADAAGAFRNAVKQNPQNYQSFFYLGESEEQLNQHEQAIAAFRTSLNVMTHSLMGHSDIEFRQNVLNGLASAIAKSDRHDEEVNSIQSQATTNGSAEDWFLLAKVFAYRGDADSAIEAYSRAEMMDPQNFYIAKEYGLYLERTGQTQKAELPLRKAYTLNSTDPDVNNALRRIGVIPGPSLKDQDALAKPLIPRGPIPEVDLNKVVAPLTGGGTSASTPND
jgi:tetratricopeptide (TPR) repeat protein